VADPHPDQETLIVGRQQQAQLEKCVASLPSDERLILQLRFGDLVFPTTGCKPKQNFLDECKAIAKRAELNKKEFYLHKFRATRATRLLQGGMDIKSVQQMLGHNDLESTMRYLGAQRTDVLQAQIEQIDSL
jgi:site-specific recombinase XerD